MSKFLKDMTQIKEHIFPPEDHKPSRRFCGGGIIHKGAVRVSLHVTAPEMKSALHMYLSRAVLHPRPRD